jgi:hypothetical protein
MYPYCISREQASSLQCTIDKSLFTQFRQTVVPANIQCGEKAIVAARLQEPQVPLREHNKQCIGSGTATIIGACDVVLRLFTQTFVCLSVCHVL